MSIFAAIQQNGLSGTALYAIEQKLGLRLRLPARLRFTLSKKSEWTFWDRYFAGKGLEWPDDYAYRMNPSAEVTPDVAEVLEGADSLNVLDVGAGCRRAIETLPEGSLRPRVRPELHRPCA
jgi:hypothetical protein